MNASESRHKNRDLSEAELRDMLEAREMELELERQRTSRKFSIILCMFALTLLASFLVFHFATRTRPEDVPVAAIPLAKPTRLAPEISDELKKFTNSSGDGDLKEDIRFAGQLLNFLNTSESKPAPAPQADRPKSGP